VYTHTHTHIRHQTRMYAQGEHVTSDGVKAHNRSPLSRTPHVPETHGYSCSKRPGTHRASKFVQRLSTAVATLSPTAIARPKKMPTQGSITNQTLNNSIPQGYGWRAGKPGRLKINTPNTHLPSRTCSAGTWLRVNPDNIPYRLACIGACSRGRQASIISLRNGLLIPQCVARPVAGLRSDTRK